MINELYNLSKAIDQAQINVQSWHKNYKPIPDIDESKPCVRITISDGKVISISLVAQEQGKYLRKYGSNQGTYPCMNLAPLYRITDDGIKEELEKLKKRCLEDLTTDDIEKIKSWCRIDNWDGNFPNKYKNSMDEKPKKLSTLVPEYRPLQSLISETDRFKNPACLHYELERVSLNMLNSKDNIKLAFDVLFHYKETPPLSVAFDSTALINEGTSAISKEFIRGLNNALLQAVSSEEKADEKLLDAFGILFAPSKQPMPEVKLAGGFSVKLRTMFGMQYCQERYGRIENDSYPISLQTCQKLQDVLGWIGDKEKKDINWVKLDKNEILFAYPSQLPKSNISFTRLFKRSSENNQAIFQEQAKGFITELRQGKELGTDSHANRIQIFILRKLDKARTKVIYTRQTDPVELEHCSEEWSRGCENLPTLCFGQPCVPFPLDTADILNCFWNHKKPPVADKFRPFPKYHGMELFLGDGFSVNSDLHNLSEKAMIIGAYLRKWLQSSNKKNALWCKIKPMLALMGMLLYQKNIRKDTYMENLPYLYGQLLKVSDELHSFYCKVVRNGDYPQQLAGGSLFRSAAESPIRTLNLLAQRIMPYYTWARSYRAKGINEKGVESWHADWMYSLYETIMTKLHENWTPQTRFNDEEKAQMFIGYLASFPKKEENKDITNPKEEHDND